MAYLITTQRDLRRFFWNNAKVSRKRNRDGDFCTDTRVAWCDWLEQLRRDKIIPEALAQRATLDG